LAGESACRNPTLRDDLVEAVAGGQFHIRHGEELDDVLQLLTGMPAGEPDAEGAEEKKGEKPPGS